MWVNVVVTPPTTRVSDHGYIPVSLGVVVVVVVAAAVIVVVHVLVLLATSRSP